MNRPWWLWEGAAVRDDEPPIWIGRVSRVHNESVTVVFLDGDGDGLKTNIELDLLTPIENPAVMLAPEGATHTHITENGNVCYTTDPVDISSGWFKDWPVFHWPKCPDNLKGHIWELPHEKD